MKLVIEKNPAKLSDAISDKFIELVENKPNCVLGLATGSSPVDTYKDIIKKAKHKKVSFANVTTFNLDEYIDNSDYEQSYVHFMNTNLFDHLDINKNKVNFPTAEKGAAYDEDIKKSGGVDLQILGIGSDGHIGFNEPGTSPDSKTHVTELDARTIKDNARFFQSIDMVPKKAITMGLDTIMQSKEIVLIATGKNKAQAIYDMFHNNQDCPASILNHHPNVTVYCDDEASSLLSKELKNK